MPINYGVITSPTDNPISYDGLSTIDFKLVFPKLPLVTMFLQTMDVPAININSTPVETRFVQLQQIGEKINYQPFRVTFLVDKNLYTYMEIYNWMKRITVSGTQKDETDNPYVIIGKQIITFVNAWPMSLDNLSFKANEDDTVYISASVSFNYDYLEISSS